VLNQLCIELELFKESVIVGGKPSQTSTVPMQNNSAGCAVYVLACAGEYTVTHRHVCSRQGWRCKCAKVSVSKFCCAVLLLFASCYRVALAEARKDLKSAGESFVQLEAQWSNVQGNTGSRRWEGEGGGQRGVGVMWACKTGKGADVFLSSGGAVVQHEGQQWQPQVGRCCGQLVGGRGGGSGV
jgi:hypothetical protein